VYSLFWEKSRMDSKDIKGNGKKVAKIKGTMPGTMDMLGIMKEGKDIWKEIEDRDEDVCEYHISSEVTGLLYFQDMMRLLAELLRGIVDPTSGWALKFRRNSPQMAALALATAGSFRSLMAAYKLVIAGYFLEGHQVLRMVEQWAEVSVVVEAIPSLSDTIIKEGIREQHKQLACRKSTEYETLLREMSKTFKNLSRRAHITATSIELTAQPRKGELTLNMAGGAASKELLNKECNTLALMTKNVIRIAGRNFRTVSTTWLSRLEKIEKIVMEYDKSLSSQLKT